MTSIIIPAHNEAAVLERSLDAVSRFLRPGDQVIVVCNGCTDHSAAVARGYEPLITCIETPVASKTGALNLGERYVSGFPRVYMDADVELSSDALDKISQSLARGDLLAASPQPLMNLDGASWAVRAYYEIWLALPYCRNGMIGAGVYALSEVGRRRFEEFPDVIADDGYVRALFKEHERGMVEGAYAIVRAPMTLSWLVKIKTRSRLGRMQFAVRFPSLVTNEAKDYQRAFGNLVRDPRKWPKMAVYLYVVLVSRLRAARQYRNLSEYRWERDLSSRKKAGAP